jgi:hypothetical protein
VEWVGEERVGGRASRGVGQATWSPRRPSRPPPSSEGVSPRIGRRSRPRQPIISHCTQNSTFCQNDSRGRERCHPGPRLRVAKGGEARRRRTRKVSPGSCARLRRSGAAPRGGTRWAARQSHKHVKTPVTQGTRPLGRAQKPRYEESLAAAFPSLPRTSPQGIKQPRRSRLTVPRGRGRGLRGNGRERDSGGNGCEGAHLEREGLVVLQRRRIFCGAG